MINELKQEKQWFQKLTNPCSQPSKTKELKILNQLKSIVDAHKLLSKSDLDRPISLLAEEIQKLKKILEMLTGTTFNENMKEELEKLRTTTAIKFITSMNFINQRQVLNVRTVLKSLKTLALLAVEYHSTHTFHSLNFLSYLHNYCLLTKQNILNIYISEKGSSLIKKQKIRINSQVENKLLYILNEQTFKYNNKREILGLRGRVLAKGMFLDVEYNEKWKQDNAFFMVQFQILEDEDEDEEIEVEIEENEEKKDKEKEKKED